MSFHLWLYLYSTLTYTLTSHRYEIRRYTLCYTSSARSLGHQQLPHLHIPVFVTVPRNRSVLWSRQRHGQSVQKSLSNWEVQLLQRHSFCTDVFERMFRSLPRGNQRLHTWTLSTPLDEDELSGTSCKLGAIIHQGHSLYRR